ncbi:hypothetical protein [Hyphomicrobium sp.]|jgi:hypothetical protein|uniref:hypothetical protein n=1 Tax=Hyphomicrobium sp. TaxID=82 RepID=UPI00356A001D
MFEIYELSAAPHLPESFKSSLAVARPENLFALLAQASEGDESIEVRMRNGEIFIALTAS